MSYFKLINGLKTVLELDSRIKTITEGTIGDYDQYKQNMPSLAHFIVTSGTVNDNLNVYDVILEVTDAVVENNNLTVEKFLSNDNRQEVFNDTDNIIRRAYRTFRRDAVGYNINVLDGATFDKIQEFDTDNRFAGWAVTFQVEVPDETMDVCQTV